MIAETRPSLETPEELSSSVHALETSPTEATHDAYEDQHPLTMQSRAQVRAHRPWSKSRSRVVNALWECGDSDLRKRASRLGRCCQMPTLRKAADGTPAASLARCRDRMCLMCGDIRGREATRRVADCVAKADELRLVTLTLADDGKDLAHRTERLFAAYRALRRSALWKEHVRGAVATLETTLGRSPRHWHVHLHVIVTGSFIPHAQLKKAWHEATGDSFIVHLNLVRGKKQAIHYIAAYLGKPIAVHTWTPEETCEYAAAMHGRRFLSTSGIFHNPTEDDDDEPDVPPPSTHLVQVHAVHAAESKGCEYTRHAGDVLSRLGTKIACVLDRPPPHLSSGLPPIDPRELAYAVAIMEEVESSFPALPNTAKCESLRRHFFSLPPPPTPPREVQGNLPQPRPQ